jgi:hypothetical protein
VPRYKRGDDLVGEHVLRHDEDVAITAVLGEIAGRERPVEIVKREPIPG